MDLEYGFPVSWYDVLTERSSMDILNEPIDRNLHLQLILAYARWPGLHSWMLHHSTSAGFKHQNTSASVAEAASINPSSY
jgi:hypothetical protein